MHVYSIKLRIFFFTLFFLSFGLILYICPKQVYAVETTQNVTISLGTGDTLTLQIRSGTPTPTVDPTAPRVRFSIKLLDAETTPDIKVRLKMVDLTSLLTPVQNAQSDSSCQDVGPGELFYTNITMSADANGIYTPKPNTVATQVTNTGTTQVAVTEEGLSVPAASVGKVYRFLVKGPKHRDMKMGAVQLVNRSTFIWTSIPLEPGDLPNPNNSNSQDCTVNSIDLSLIVSRIGQSDAEALVIGDVNYDTVINGNDISKVVRTLSTKPDDEQ